MSAHKSGPFEGKRGLSVEVRGDNVESAIRTLGRKMKQEGVIREIRERQYYEKPCVRRRRKQAEARARAAKLRLRQDKN